MQSPSPFFTNDWEGFFKIIGVMAGIITPTILFIWKVLQGPLKDADKALGDDINAVGEKVNQITTRQEKHTTEYQLLERRVSTVELEQKYLREAFAEIRASVSELRESGNDNKVEIVGKFEEIMEKVRLDFNQLREMVIRSEAKHEERDRIQDLIDKAVNRA